MQYKNAELATKRELCRDAFPIPMLVPLLLGVSMQSVLEENPPGTCSTEKNTSKVLLLLQACFILQ